MRFRVFVSMVLLVLSGAGCKRGKESFLSRALVTTELTFVNPTLDLKIQLPEGMAAQPPERSSSVSRLEYSLLAVDGLVTVHLQIVPTSTLEREQRIQLQIGSPSEVRRADRLPDGWIFTTQSGSRMSTVRSLTIDAETAAECRAAYMGLSDKVSSPLTQEIARLEAICVSLAK